MIDLAWERELMWAAGFFDGEGHAHFHRGLRVMLSQRHREPLDRFYHAFGVGKVIETEKDGRALFHYYAQNGTDTKYVLELLLSRVSEVKREQIATALAAYSERVVFGSPEHRANLRGKRKPTGPRSAEVKARISASHLRIERSAA